MNIDRTWLRKALRDVSTFGQIGFQIVVPPVMLCILGVWLNRRFGLGPWVVLLCIIIGLLCAFTSIYKLCKYFLLKNTKEEDENRIIFYRHHS